MKNSCWKTTWWKILIAPVVLHIVTKKRGDSEDIVNESVVKAIRSINRLENPQYIKAWFYC